MKARLIAGVAIAAAALAASLAVGVANGKAYSTGYSGAPGAVTFPTWVRATHDTSVNGGWPEFVLGAYDVYRSPAYTGAQVVTLYQVAELWTTSYGWQPWNRNIFTVTLQPNQYWGLSSKVLQLSPDWSAQVGTFRVEALVTWKTDTGYTLGTKLISYDGGSNHQDYACWGTLGCQAFNGWVSFF